MHGNLFEGELIIEALSRMGNPPEQLSTLVDFAKKHGMSHYGYKSHVKADKKAKLIEKCHTTDTGIHDSNVIEPGETDKGQDLRFPLEFMNQ